MLIDRLFGEEGLKEESDWTDEEMPKIILVP
jgi:hypothetical protein